MKPWQHHLVPTRRRKKEGTGKNLNKNPPRFQWAVINLERGITLTEIN